MNAESEATHPGLPPSVRWSWKKTFLVILFAFAAHFVFLYVLGEKHPPAPRAANHVPVLQLADNSDELVRLTDPTLFVLPHAEDFPIASWSRTPAFEPPANGWTQPNAFLAPDVAALGAAFNAFMQTNRFATPALDFKPEAQLVVPQVTIEPVLPQRSTWRLAGELAGRRMLNTLSVPTLAVDDVLAPSRVQLLVDADGNVVSPVLLDSSEDANADQQALALARTLRFAPANRLMFGEIIFNWHTVPATAP
jgi:TonB family protein